MRTRIQQITPKNKPIYILGVSNGHIATATLLKDGTVIASASEERFLNIKNYNGFPKQAINWCLDYAGIASKDLSLVVTPYLYRPPIFAPIEQKHQSRSILWLEKASRLVNTVRFQFRKTRYYLPFLKPVGYYLYRIAVYTVGAYYTINYKNFLATFLDIDKEKILAFDHHLSHAAGAYYASPFNKKKVLVLTLDAEGDNYAATVNLFRGAKFQVLAKTPREHSFGYLYGLTTKFLGMKPHDHEYKVMGLAPYAKKEDIEKTYNKLTNYINLDPKNPLKFKTWRNSQDFEYYLRKNMANTRFDWMAGAIQQLLEEKVINWVKMAIKKTGISTLALSGGVFMNVKLNQKIAELKEVKNLFILPSCGDETTPLGACYLGHRVLTKNKKQSLKVPAVQTLYWGPEFSDQDIEKALRKIQTDKRYSISKIWNIETKVAQLLAQGQVVARFAGRMEFGARALGNRSILADPRDPKVVMEINEMIKKRDFWMPFTPSILSDRAQQYLHLTHNIKPHYMIITFNATEAGKRDLAAAMHPYDFTIRPQVVEKSWNISYYKILKEFEKLTGIGGVLNTSFNIHGFPIALGPKEALRILEHSGLRYLALEHYLIMKNQSHRSVL